MIELAAERLFVHPVKGCAATEVAELSVSPGGGVDGDRRYALAIDEPPAAGDGVHRSKRHFYNGMRFPEMVRISPQIDEGSSLSSFAVPSDDGEGVVLGPERLAAAAAGVVDSKIPPRLVEAAAAQRFADRPEPFVSIINLNTLDAFAAWFGDPGVAVPARWRCNIYVRAAIGAEYRWAAEKARLQIGGAALDVADYLGRCKMITAEPLRGRVDHEGLLYALGKFEREYGLTHPGESAPVMGVLALPAAAALIKKDPASE